MGKFSVMVGSSVSALLLCASVSHAASVMGSTDSAVSLSPAATVSAPADANGAAAPDSASGTPTLALAPPTPQASSQSNSSTAGAQAASGTQFLDDAAAADRPAIHGFFDVPFKTAYITPRGLVVQDKGLVVQPVGGLIFDLYDATDGPVNNVSFIGGVWNSIDSAESNPAVGSYDESDPFGTVDSTLFKNFELSVTYVLFISPQDAYKTENNIETKFAYNDTDLLHDFALHPYMKYFYEVKGSSTVVTGRAGGTYDIELGITPSYTYKGIENYPITFTFPALITVGPKSYWGGTQDFGTVQASVDLSVPLAFVPVKFGFWHAEAGFTFVYDINHKLREAAEILGNGTDPSRFVGSAGVGVNF